MRFCMRLLNGAFGLARCGRAGPTRWTTTTPLSITHAYRYLATVAPPPARSHDPKAIQLRPYQEECIQSVLDYLGKGERRLGVSLATGSGKTVLFSHLIDRVQAPTPDATQTLIIAHRQELVQQAAKHCRDLYPDKTVQIEQGTSHASGYADVTVASVASLYSGTRLLKFDPSRFKLIIVDEAHHIVANQYLQVLRHFGLLDAGRSTGNGDTALVGVSATLSRADGLSLGKVLDHIVYHKDYLDMIQDEWLAHLIFTTVQSGVDLTKVKTGRGDFQTGALSKAVNNDETNARVVRAWLEKARSRSSTLVFCVDLSHVSGMTAMFRQHGIDARFVTGDTNATVRAERLDDFRAGKYPVLINCGIFTEGTDIPNIDCVVLARPTRSRNLLVQMIGRGLRKSPGKVNCHVIDFVSSLETGIVTTPTLFGLDPDELVDEADVHKMKAAKARKENEQLREQELQKEAAQSVPALSGDLIFTDYDDVNDLIQDTSGERRIRGISPFAWVQIDEGRYVLSSTAGDIDLVRVSQGKEYHVYFKQRLPTTSHAKSPFARPRTVGQSFTFEHAVQGADAFAKKKFVHSLVSKSARWRSFPASENQVAFLNRFRGEDEKLEAGDITKGRAGDFITKIKRGARGRFNRIVGEKRKTEKVEQKKSVFQAMQRKQDVKVGRVEG